MSTKKDVTVFIVEDQPIVRAGLIFMLQELGDVKLVGEAADGETAVAKVLELRPDVTLMDISLPELDGISATKQIKKSWPTARILMLTTHENDDYIFTSLTAGADGYCLKNATVEQLGLAIDVVKNGSVWLDPGIAQRVLRSYTEPTKKPKEEEEDKVKKFALTNLEQQMLRMLVEGLNNHEMADRLASDVETIKADMSRIVAKLAVADRTQAAIAALKQGLVSMDCVTWRILRDARPVD